MQRQEILNVHSFVRQAGANALPSLVIPHRPDHRHLVTQPRQRHGGRGGGTTGGSNDPLRDHPAVRLRPRRQADDGVRGRQADADDRWGAHRGIG